MTQWDVLRIAPSFGWKKELRARLTSSDLETRRRPRQLIVSGARPAATPNAAGTGQVQVTLPGAPERGRGDTGTRRTEKQAGNTAPYL